MRVQKKHLVKKQLIKMGGKNRIHIQQGKIFHSIKLMRCRVAINRSIESILLLKEYENNLKAIMKKEN
jgi:hypothetical protein